MSSQRGIVIVLAGPSGVGKTSIVERLLATDAGLHRSINITTRQPRAGEVNGQDYYFVDQHAYDDMVATGNMLEHATVFGHCYGIPRGPVVSALEEGRDLIIVADWQGHRTLRSALPGDVLGIYIAPPSLRDLEHRLVLRGDGEDLIRSRMAEARAEMSHQAEFDRVVWNGCLDQAVLDTQAIIDDAKQEMRA